MQDVIVRIAILLEIFHYLCRFGIINVDYLRAM